MDEKRDLIKTLLVDDEEKTRNLLKLLVDWESLGFEVVGEASSGQEGLYMLENLQPELILTDIKMPYMDGLQFAELARSQCPGIKIIILTAYEDFGFAQQSIRIGISDYLLKPMKREKLKSILQKIREEIIGESDFQQEYGRMKEQFIKCRNLIQEKFLNELLYLGKSGKETEQKIHYFSLDSLENYVQAAVLALNRGDRDSTGENNMILNMVSVNLVRSYFQKCPKVFVFEDQLDNIVIANTDKELPLQNSCEEIRSIVSGKTKRNASVGVGMAYQGAQGLSKSYQEACETLKYCIIYGDEVVLHFKDVSVTESASLSPGNRFSDIEFFVRAGLRRETVEAIRRNLEKQPLRTIEDMNAVRVNGINLATLLINIASDIKLPFSSQEFSDLYAKIIAASSVTQMEKYLIDFAIELVSGIHNARKRKSNKLIDSILNYIHENMADPALGLSSISAQFYINPSYLSRTFKRHVGYTVVEYLTMKRIEKAKELFSLSNQMAYQIGEKVGIPEPNYFGKCFKKYAGCSIQEYRKKMQVP